MTEPLLSFIIPTYNRARLLTRALESVVLDEVSAATRSEVIVVDDGSTDGTAEIVAPWVAAGHVIYVALGKNRGVAAARNAAIDLARGRWLVLLDSDNQLVPGATAQLRHELTDLPESVGIFWGNCRLYDGRTTTTHGVTGIVPGGHLVEGRYPGEHFSVVRAALARRHRFAELSTRNECAACFWYPIALESELCLSATIFQFYETDGDDRITSLVNRRDRAPELVRCFEETLLRFGPLLLERTPAVFWGMHGRIALYLSVAGLWVPSIRAAVHALRGWRVQPTNVAVFLLCLSGPRFARAALKGRTL